jgi:ATP-binding cassette subfamily C protein CydD
VHGSEAEFAGAASWLRAQQAPARRAITRAVAFNTLGGLLVVPQAWLLALAVSAVVMHGAPLAQVAAWLLPIPFIVAARFALTQVAERSAFDAAALVKTRVRDHVVRRLQGLGPAHARGMHSGELAVAAIDAVDALDPYYARYLPHMALVAAMSVSIAVFVLWRDWISGVVMLLTAPVIPIFMILIGRVVDRLSARQWQRLARMSARFLDALRGLTTLKLFDASRREAELLSRLSDDYRRSTMSVLRVAFLSALVLEFFTTVGIALIAVLIGFRLMSGTLSFEAGFFVLLLAPEFYMPLRQLGSHYHARMEAVAAAERIARLTDTAPAIRGGERATPATKIDIRFEDVHFAYEPGRDALRGATFAVDAQGVTALVGASGAGKTTALNILLGFLRPGRGRVLVGGHDLNALDRSDWLRRVAWVPQRPHLFAGSILDNIRMNDASVDETAVRTAARLAHADVFIDRLPCAYDTTIGERGQTLSGGEAQRIALARAFLKDAPVLLMDEPTANLDRETEALLADAIARLALGRTVLVVAHRLRTVQCADRIVVLESGRVVEQGTHDGLLRGDAHYARMVRDSMVTPWATISAS